MSDPSRQDRPGRSVGELLRRVIALGPLLRLLLLVVLVGIAILIGLPAVLARAAGPG